MAPKKKVTKDELYKYVRKLYKAKLFDGSTAMELNRRIEALTL